MRIGNELHGVFCDNVDEQIHFWRAADGSWQREPAGDPNVLPPPDAATGSGVAYVYQNALHVVARAGPDGHLVDIFKGDGGRRGTNGAINEIFDDAGTWRTGIVSAFGAADPTAYVDANGNAAVSFVANDGVHAVRLVNGAWV
jgi:hypothetical protein